MKKVILSLLLILLLVPQLLRLANFEARENDSRLYTHFVKQLSKKPLGELIALEWQGLSPYRDPENPYVRDHLVGQFIPSVLLTKMGWDWKYSHYIVNQIYRFFIPWLFFLIFVPLIGKGSSALILIAAHINPQALNYGLRANQEQPLVFALALAIWGYFHLSRRRGVVALYLGALYAFLVKGLAGLVFFPLWGGHALLGYKKNKERVFFLLGLAVFLFTSALVYETWFSHITGFSFWDAYFEIQIFGRRSSAGSTPFSSLGYYLVRSLSYALPWSLGLFLIRKLEEKERDTISLLITLSVGVVFLFGYFGRKASRYIFPVYYFLASVGAFGIAKKLNKKIPIDALSLHVLLYWGIFLIQFLVYCYKGKTYVI